MNNRSGNDKNTPRRDAQNQQNRQRSSPQSGNRAQNPYILPEERARRAAYAKRRREAEEARQNAIREENRRRTQRKKEMRAKEHRKNLKIFGGRFLVFAVVLLIMCAAAAVIFAIIFNHTPDEPLDSGKITYYYGGDNIRSSPTKAVVLGKNVYFCFNDLSDYLGMAESGDSENMKFILPDENYSADAVGNGHEEIVIFHTDMTRVTLGGQTVILEIPNVLQGDEIWVCTDFISEYMNNVSVSFDERKAEILISKLIDEEKSTEDSTVYLPVSFKLKNPTPIPPIENPDGSNAPSPDIIIDSEETYELNFINDLSDYEKYMNPEDRDAYLTLVNTKNHLTESDIPSDLTYVKDAPSWRSEQQLREYAEKSLEALFIEMRASGYYNMMVLSCYRPYSQQRDLFAQYTANEMASNPSLSKEEAEKIVLTYSTRAGTSEHQTGLAVDMDTLGTFSTDFQYEPEYAWLKENAWKFGFILRFPADKTDITTIQFEPWHYRFVGRYHAKKIHDSGLCLEEYVELLNKR